MKTTAIVTALASVLVASAWADSIPFAYDIFDQLKSEDHCERYIGPEGAPYRPPAVNGELQMRVLRHVEGMPMCNAVLANVHSLRPSTIRIVSERPSAGHLRPWRVTIVVRDGKVQAVYQDVETGYASGADVEFITTAIRDGSEAARDATYLD